MEGACTEVCKIGLGTMVQDWTWAFLSVKFSIILFPPCFSLALQCWNRWPILIVVSTLYILSLACTHREQAQRPRSLRSPQQLHNLLPHNPPLNRIDLLEPFLLLLQVSKPCSKLLYLPIMPPSINFWSHTPKIVNFLCNYDDLMSKESTP